MIFGFTYRINRKIKLDVKISLKNDLGSEIDFLIKFLSTFFSGISNSIAVFIFPFVYEKKPKSKGDVNHIFLLFTKYQPKSLIEKSILMSFPTVFHNLFLML